MNWASPITVEEDANTDREVAALLWSSPNSWKTTSTAVQPDFDLHPEFGFPAGSDRASYTLAVAVQGVFESAYRESGALAPTEGEEVSQQNQMALITTSAPTARLVVFGSAEFLDDTVFQISTSLSMDRYLNSLKVLQNAVAWSTEDTELLEIQSGGSASRLLAPLNEGQQSFLEGANYVLALLALVAVGIVWNVRRRSERPLELVTSEAIEAKRVTGEGGQ